MNVLRSESEIRAFLQSHRVSIPQRDGGRRILEVQDIESLEPDVPRVTVKRHVGLRIEPIITT